MTAASFQQKIKDIYKPYFGLPEWATWLLVGIAFCLLVILVGHGWAMKALKPWELLLILALYGLVIAYGIWCWKQAYRIYQFNSPKNIREKTDIIENYTERLKVVWRYSEGNYHSITYRNRLFMRIDLRFYIDQNKILANIQPTASYNSGRGKNNLNIVLAHTATKKLKKYLEAQL